MAGKAYSDSELFAIYELGRLYFEMGYFAPAERIFSGLAAVDGGRTPARCGLGLVKLERGLYEQSQDQLRLALQDRVYPTQAKLGLVAVFIAVNEIPRAKSMLVELAAELEKSEELDPALRSLWEAFAIRCDAIPAT